MMLATVVIDFTTISVVSCSNDVMKGDDADVAVASPSLLPLPLPLPGRLPSMATIRDYSNSVLSAWSWATFASKAVTDVSIGSGTWVAFQTASYSVLQVSGVMSPTSIPSSSAASSVVIFVNLPRH